MSILLNLDELLKIVTEDYPDINAELVSSKLKNNNFIQNQILYTLDEKLKVYKRNTRNFDDGVKLLASNLIEFSVRKLNSVEMEYYKLATKGNKSKIMQFKHIEKYLSQLILKLENYDIQIDNRIGEIHFTNGFIDLYTNEFKERDPNQQYITSYINRDYKPSTETARNKLFKLLKRIYPKPENLKCILEIFGSAVSGRSINDQDYLILNGSGGTGKSTMLLLTKKALPVYFMELTNDILAKNNNKVDKVFNSLSPALRFIHINEPKEGQTDSDIFKILVEGVVQVTKLYKEGVYTKSHNAKVILTMNSLLNIKWDDAVDRRINAYTHTSRFVSDDSLVNEERHIYKKDKFLLDNLTEEDLNSWVDILSEYARQFLLNPSIHYPKDFILAKNNIKAENDIIGEFLQDNIIKTDNITDKIASNKLYELFREKCIEDYHILEKYVLSEKVFRQKLENDKQIIYRRDCNEKDTPNRKFYIGVKYKNTEDKTIPILNHTTELDDYNQIAMVSFWKQEAEDWKQEAEDWKRKYEELVQSKKEEIPPTEPAVVQPVKLIKVKKIIKKKTTPPPIKVDNVEIEFHKIYKQDEITDDTLMNLF